MTTKKRYAIERIEDKALLTAQGKTVSFETIEEAEDEIKHQSLLIDEYEKGELRIVEV